MQQIFHRSALAFALATSIGLGLAAPDVLAGDGNLNDSQVSVLVTSVSAALVVSGPLFLSAAGVRKAADMSGGHRDGRARRATAGNLPDMRVKSVGTNAEGGRQVALEDPANPENTAMLQWPKRNDDPAAGFNEGTLVAFQPSPQGTGWMLRNPQGAALAFVPTIEAADESRTSTL